MRAVTSFSFTPTFIFPFQYPKSHRASLIAQVVKNLPVCRRPQFNLWVGKIPCRRDRLPTPVFVGFPGDSAGKESTSNMGDPGLIFGLGRSPGEGKGYPLQYSGLENSMDYIVHGVTKCQTWLRNFHISLLRVTLWLKDLNKYLRLEVIGWLWSHLA